MIIKRLPLINYGLALIFSIAISCLFLTTVSAVGQGVQCLNSDQTAKLDAAGNPIQCDSGLTCRFRQDHPNGPGGYCTSGSNSTSTSSDRAIGKIQAPEFIRNLGFGAAGLSNVLSNIIQIIYVVAAIMFVFMVVISAFQWIISGGDKEKISQARGRLTNAVIGIFLLAMAFVIIRVVGQITGFEFFSGQNNPLPDLPTPATQDTTIKNVF